MRDTERVMVILIGEQPAPNLIPIRVHRPEVVVGVYTTQTEKVYNRLARMLDGARAVPCEVQPHNLADVREKLLGELADYAGDDVVFNLTGGTKIMALAAYDTAQELGSRFLYLDSQKPFMCLQIYSFQEGRPVLFDERDLAETITLTDYLRSYVGKESVRTRGEQNKYEKQVENALVVFDDLPQFERMARVNAGKNLEIDLMLRYGNNIGAIEVKRSESYREAIGQLASATAQRILGTFVRRIVVCGEPPDVNNEQLAEISRTTIVVLPSLLSGQLTEEDQRELVRSVGEVMRIPKEDYETQAGPDVV